MCIKAGADELESVKNLMGMALKAVVAEALQAELEDVVETARLVEDLHMGQAEAQTLRDLIADTFDDIRVNLDEIPTYAALLEYVVLREFHGLNDKARDCDLAA